MLRNIEIIIIPHSNNKKFQLNVFLGNGVYNNKITKAEALRILKPLQKYLTEAAEDHIRRETKTISRPKKRKVLNVTK